MTKKAILLSAALLLSFGVLFSQPADPPGTPGSNNPVVGSGGEDPVDIPIDGGAILLLIGGAAYGIRKFRKNKVKQ